MPHTRYPRAAVATAATLTVAFEDAFGAFPSRAQFEQRPNSGPRPKVLWAARPLQVRAGRLVGVRLRGSALEVALVAPGAEGLRWVAANSVLTSAQGEVWARTSEFDR